MLKKSIFIIMVREVLWDARYFNKTLRVLDTRVSIKKERRRRRKYFSIVNFRLKIATMNE